MHARSLLPLVAALIGTFSYAQMPTARIRVGDTLPTGDALTQIFGLQTDDDGGWFAWVDSDFADVTQDGLLLHDGQVILREGSALAGPAGSSLGDVLSFAVGANGDLAAILQVRIGAVTVDGLYFNGRPLALAGDVLGAPEVPAGTTWDRVLGFRALWLGPTRTLLVLAAINNPNVAGPREDALVRFQLDGAGNVVATNVLLTKGQFVPALGGAVTSLGSGSNSANSFALNARGDFVGVVFSTGAPGVILKNLDTVLAQEGQAAPIPGRTYRSFRESKVAINDSGETAFTALLDGLVNRYCIIKNGEKFVQEGDALPLMPQPVGNDTASLAPIFLTNSGDLFWRVWDDGRNNDGFVRNRDRFVYRNLHIPPNEEAIGLARDESAFHVSRAGRFSLCRVSMRDFVPGHPFYDTLLAVDFGLAVPVPGCLGNAARLAKVGGEVRSGQHLSLALDGAQSLGALPLLYFAAHSAVPGSPCGLPFLGGEILIAPESRFALFVGGPWPGTPVTFGGDIPADRGLTGLEFFAQGAFLDSRGGAPWLRLSNGMRFEIGAR